MWIKKIECAQRFLSVLSMSVGVECGVWSVEYDSAVSGEPPNYCVHRYRLPKCIGAIPDSIFSLVLVLRFILSY